MYWAGKSCQDGNGARTAAPNGTGTFLGAIYVVCGRAIVLPKIKCQCSGGHTWHGCELANVAGRPGVDNENPCVVLQNLITRC